MQLVIVESRAKCRKLRELLDEEYIVMASLGHIADLPANSLGIDANFALQLELTSRGSHVVKTLKEHANQASCVWLAMDLDKEGEAIAAHLVQFLQLENYYRLILPELTKEALAKGFAAKRKINPKLLAAQQARRIIDRLVGYTVSPYLTSLANKPLTAGRVQSLALRLLLERERAIRDFQKVAHFGVKMLLEAKDARWITLWDTKPFCKEDPPYVVEKEIAVKILQITSATVKNVEQKIVFKKPPPPFITSTLQQAASLQLKLSPEQTMAEAKGLFEAGLITYYHTDEPNLASTCLPMLHAVLKNMGYANSIAQEPNLYKARNKVLEADEAIRPADFLLEEPKDLEPIAFSLYKLIRLRALASQMSHAQIEIKTITVAGDRNVDEQIPTFIAKGYRTIELGWRQITPTDLTKEQQEEVEDLLLPDLTIGEKINIKSKTLLEQMTAPPPRFNEITLVKELEERCFGHTTTYATVVHNIKTRNYVNMIEQKLVPTSTAELIVDLLVPHFKFIEFSYSACLEQDLELIAQGKKSYLEVITAAKIELDNNLVNLKQTLKMYACPTCGAELKKLQGKFGAFWGCSRYKLGCTITCKDVKGEPWFNSSYKKLDVEKNA